MMGCSGRSHGDRDADTNTTQGWHIHGHARVQVCKSLTLIDKYYTHMLNTHTHTQIAVYPSRVWFSAWCIAATFFPDTLLFQFGLWSEGGLVAARCNLPWEKKTLIYCSTFLLLLWFLTVHFTQPGSTLIAQKKYFLKKQKIELPLWPWCNFPWVIIVPDLELFHRMKLWFFPGLSFYTNSINKQAASLPKNNLMTHKQALQHLPRTLTWDGKFPREL